MSLISEDNKKLTSRTPNSNPIPIPIENTFAKNEAHNPRPLALFAITAFVAAVPLVRPSFSFSFQTFELTRMSQDLELETSW